MYAAMTSHKQGEMKFYFVERYISLYSRSAATSETIHRQVNIETNMLYHVNIYPRYRNYKKRFHVFCKSFEQIHCESFKIFINNVNNSFFMELLINYLRKVNRVNVQFFIWHKDMDDAQISIMTIITPVPKIGSGQLVLEFYLIQLCCKCFLGELRVSVCIQDRVQLV